ncbi:MAG: hypothetical protein K6F28_04400 [Lachnospiraceae bacterium]|nr:hypothetical protein [Lachnospiraceae bacterium]
MTYNKKGQTGEEMLSDEELNEAGGGFDWDKVDWDNLISLCKVHSGHCPFCGADDADRIGYGPEGYHLYECGGCGREYLGPA